MRVVLLLLAFVLAAWVHTARVEAGLAGELQGASSSLSAATAAAAAAEASAVASAATASHSRQSGGDQWSFGRPAKAKGDGSGSGSGSGGSAGGGAVPATTLKKLSDGKAASYPRSEYAEVVKAPFAAAGRDGVKTKAKACVNCFLFNSKHKIAKKYSDMLKAAMGGTVRTERMRAIGTQLGYQDAQTMRDRTGDQAYGTGADSDIGRRRKDAAEKKCLDLPPDEQSGCLRKAKALQPDPITGEEPAQRSTNAHSMDEPAPPNAGPPFNAFVETAAAAGAASASGERQLPDSHANEVLVNPELAAGTLWDTAQVRSYTDPVESANVMGPGDDGLTLLLQTVVCGNEYSSELLTALYQAVVGDDLVVQCEPALH